MEASHKILDLVTDLLEQLPSLLTILGCMVFAVVRWKRNPKVSMVALIGLALLFLNLIVFSVIYNWVPDLFTGYRDQVTVTRNVYLVLGVTTNCALGLALAVLLTTIFVQRPKGGYQQ
jgi:hypothetical protein